MKRVQQFRNNSEESNRMTALQTQYTFHNTYPDSKKRQSSPESSELCQESTPFCSSGTTDREDATPSGHSTPLSSALSEEVIDPAMYLVESWPVDKLMGCTAGGPLEATPDTPQEIQGPLHGYFPTVKLIGRVPIRDNQGEESHDKPLPLDQAGTEF
ncbi:hypothetical protein BKA56DRAFT_666050 [Ilyonectria sp. MPI-CAGE-AT-0026]|nr:hypothetical protein BKA56DRAFT_666050 [Ilyonectria sp. MPI-CAGE-AT-0026]